MYRSGFGIHNGVLIGCIGQDADDPFIENLCRSAEAPLAILAIDNAYESALQYAEKAASLLRAGNICTVCICRDLTEIDENGHTCGIPPELQLQPLKNTVNTLIIVQNRKRAYDFVTDMLLSLHGEEPDQAEFLAEKLCNGGYAYYNSCFRQDTYNTELLMEHALFDSLFICPFYLSRQVLCTVETGDGFKMDTEKSMGDEGIMASCLSDHLQTENLHFTVQKNQYLPTLVTGIHLLFCGFDAEDFGYDENGTAHYIDAGDPKLKKRIDRMLTVPFLTKEKQKQHKLPRK